ncbi:MAG: hypothetical protein HC919_07685 [Oscillatoriales cyanobacterium SM2_2_1]|nr:hypothetical protein [Oscillatoriales cyanobacterium SM2_2_1]
MPLPVDIPMTRYLTSEQYRQMLVRDGDRRFKEWHNRFLSYQRKFQQELRSSRS